MDDPGTAHCFRSIFGSSADSVGSSRRAGGVVALAAAVVAILPASAGAQAPAEKPRSKSEVAAKDLVKLELVADRSAIRPGAKFTLAARFALAPGWHIYWENPGEAGLATEVDFAVPAGYRAGPVRFPGPVRFQTPGETVASYGYSDVAVLSSTVVAPSRAASESGPIQFSVQASWLACRDVCIRGKGSAALELPLAGAGRPTRAAHAELFDRHRRELPRPFADLRGARQRWERDGRGVRLVVGVPRTDAIEYFPPTTEDLQLVGQESSAAAKGGRELVLNYKPGYQPARVRGVLAVTQGADRRYYAVDLQEAP